MQQKVETDIQKTQQLNNAMTELREIIAQKDKQLETKLKDALA